LVKTVGNRRDKSVRGRSGIAKRRGRKQLSGQNYTGIGMVGHGEYLGEWNTDKNVSKRINERCADKDRQNVVCRSQWPRGLRHKMS
jgi:hypothetical protein